MKRFASARIGIDQGSHVLFSDFADGGPMWTGSGPREVRHKVSFRESFRQPPAVMVSISMWDMDQKTNLRADISAEKVTKSGCQIVFRTWGDTRVARIRADWVAIGPLGDDDDWDVE